MYEMPTTKHMHDYETRNCVESRDMERRWLKTRKKSVIFERKVFLCVCVCMYTYACPSDWRTSRQRPTGEPAGECAYGLTGEPADTLDWRTSGDVRMSFWKKRKTRKCFWCVSRVRAYVHLTGEPADNARLANQRGSIRTAWLANQQVLSTGEPARMHAVWLANQQTCPTGEPAEVLVIRGEEPYMCVCQWEPGTAEPLWGYSGARDSGTEVGCVKNVILCKSFLELLIRHNGKWNR
jgi:hypothetical protein